MPDIERAAKRLAPADSFTREQPKLILPFDTSEPRIDAAADPVIEHTIEALRIRLTEKFTRANTSPALMRILRKLGTFNSAELSRILRIDIRSDLGLAEIQEAFINDNLALINGVTRKSVSDVRQVLVSSPGRRAEHIVADVMERMRVSESRATLIARDQVLKKNGALHRIRQTRAGVTEYEWVTSGDEKVRDTHQANNWRVFKWAIPPAGTGHPGEDIQCRCTALPRLPGID